ncbi:MAG TPA: ATP-dependent helicase HrpB [Xanthomonadaceae bacterium]|nr:ATP-dependent helicase HrpB [Xanthomonadaceae bacterium]
MTPAGPLPIAPLLPRILASLAAHPRLLLQAPPGAGKTTQVPPALLAAHWLGDRRVLMLEPRRIAARAAAHFMAAQCGEAVGHGVGYRIRHEARVSAATRIEVVTEGILTRMLQDDPTLQGVGAVLFDEFHERHLHGDLGLALALDVQQSLRPDLRIVVMSATLEGERLTRWLDAPRLASEGRGHPVTIQYQPPKRDEALAAQVRRAVAEALPRSHGDVLVFLPGRREIELARSAVAALADAAGIEVAVLHGELDLSQQAAVLAPSSRRRIVLATNLAESSITLSDVRAVVDTGLAREPRFDPNSGFARLHTVTISQASADQRAGRAGRTAPGLCLRLWPESQRLEPARRPEIAQVDLSALRLELAAWGEAGLRFPDPPPPGALAQAQDLLQRLGALDADARISARGRRMLVLGTHPRLAAMLLAPAHVGLRALACDVAALIESRDPLRADARSDDLCARWQALAAHRARRPQPQANRSVLESIERESRHWRRRLDLREAATAPLERDAIGRCLARAYPDRIACQDPGDPGRYRLANGRGAHLAPDSALYGEPWLAIAELRWDPRDSRILSAAPLREATLREDFPERFYQGQDVLWDATARAVTAQRVLRFDRIVLQAHPGGRVDPQRARAALLQGVRELGLEALPWTPALRQWRARIQCLCQWRPQHDRPAFDDEALLATLGDWLGPALEGITRLSALPAEAFAQALKSRLAWPLQRELDALAPARLQVPSGRQRALQYQPGQPPVLAVKLQELFGLADTPRIAEGRVPVLLHLLSPAGRPIQVTGDLAGFWERTYPEVRKQLKGRYPKHPWPEDPWSATPTHRAKPRSKV